MKTIGWVGTRGMFLLFALIGGIYGFQVSTASDDVDVSKRQDFATEDTTFSTNENIYIRIPLDEITGLRDGKALLNVLVKAGKTKYKGGAKLTIKGDKTAVSYRDDIQPLFTKGGAWFNYGGTAAGACVTCHAGDDGIDPEECPPECHLMDLGTRAGMLNGADGGSVPILGESAVGATDYDWGKSDLRKRLRNNRMPPGFPFVIDESNRNGPDISTTNDGNDLALTGSQFFAKIDGGGEYGYGGDTHAVGLIEAWVTGTNAGLNEDAVVPYGGAADVTWADVAPFFTQRDTWYNGGLACTYCHFSNKEPPSFHAMDLSSPAGLRAGADGGEEPILGESVVGSTDFNWSKSGLRKRLRNNRMPPEAPFVLDESNRDGLMLVHPVTGSDVSAVDLIGEWVDAGCLDN